MLQYYHVSCIHSYYSFFSASVCEIKDLQTLLEDEKYRNRTFEDSLIVAKVQISQLEEQLCAATSAKSNVIIT